MKLFKFSQQWGKTLRETGGGEAQEMVFMLMLMLEVTHFPMAGIGKPFKNYLPFSLKKKSAEADRNEERIVSLLSYSLAGIITEGEGFTIEQKKKIKTEHTFCY
jgi:hypothetical protein